MQALTPTLCLCHAAADGDAAAAIATFLERGADVSVFLPEGLLREGESLAAKAREARMADLVLVLFSRASMPSRWPRAEWEDALVREPAEENVRIAFAVADDCVPPRVLSPRFDLAGLALKGLRGLKRWVRGQTAAAEAHSADVEVLGIALADRPGVETVSSADTAREFVAAFGNDFDAVIPLACRRTPLVALAGELGAQLGLRLEGDLGENLDRLREFCAARRLLTVLEETGAAEPDLIFGGRCSTLICAEAVTSPVAHDPLRELQDALQTAAWPAVSGLARQARRMAREQGRLAECFAIMRHWHKVAEAQQDRVALDESAREMVWLLETWGEEEEARILEQRRAREYDDQMTLPMWE